MSKMQTVVGESVIDGLTVREINGEPTVSDLELARRLGYENPYNIRKVIDKLIHEKILSDSDVFSVSEKTPTGGRPAHRAYMLNESGALDVCLASRTATARAIYREVKQVFMAWRHGRLPANTNAAPVLALPPALLELIENQGAMLEKQGAIIEAQGAMIANHAQLRDNDAKRISFLEQHISTNGLITRPQLAELRTTIRNIAILEHNEAGRWGSRKAASFDIYRELREATGWGDRSQPWRLLPQPLIHTTMLVLRRREAKVLVELRHKQTKLDLS